MGRTMARRGTGAPLMKMRGLVEDLSEGEEEEEVLAGGGGVAVELGMMPLVPVTEDEPEPEPDPEPDPELEPDPEPDPELVDDGLRMPDKNLEASGEIGRPGSAGGPGGLGVGCEGPEGRLRDGKVGEAPEFRSRRRARRDGGVGGSIVEMRLAIPRRRHSLTHLHKPPRGCGGKGRRCLPPPRLVRPSKQRKGKQEACGMGGGDPEVIKLVVAASHPRSPSHGVHPRDENRLLGLH